MLFIIQWFKNILSFFKKLSNNLRLVLIVVIFWQIQSIVFSATRHMSAGFYDIRGKHSIRHSPSQMGPYACFRILHILSFSCACACTLLMRLYLLFFFLANYTFKFLGPYFFITIKTWWCSNYLVRWIFWKE